MASFLAIVLALFFSGFAGKLIAHRKPGQQLDAGRENSILKAAGSFTYLGAIAVIFMLFLIIGFIQQGFFSTFNGAVSCLGTTLPFLTLGLICLGMGLERIELRGDGIIRTSWGRKTMIHWSDVTRVGIAGISGKLVVYGIDGTRIPILKQASGTNQLISIMKKRSPKAQFTADTDFYSSSVL